LERSSGIRGERGKISLTKKTKNLLIKKRKIKTGLTGAIAGQPNAQAKAQNRKKGGARKKNRRVLK